MVLTSTQSVRPPCPAFISASRALQRVHSGGKMFAPWSTYVVSYRRPKGDKSTHYDIDCLFQSLKFYQGRSCLNAVQWGSNPPAEFRAGKPTMKATGLNMKTAFTCGSSHQSYLTYNSCVHSNETNLFRGKCQPIDERRSRAMQHNSNQSFK